MKSDDNFPILFCILLFLKLSQLQSEFHTEVLSGTQILQAAIKI